MLHELETEIKATGVPSGAPVAFSGAVESVFAGQFDALRTIEKFLVFFLDNCCYGVSARSVAEVSRPLAVAILPHSPPWLAGVANLRGEIIPVLNPAKIFGAGAEQSFFTGKFIVLRAKSFDSPLILPVDRLSEIAAFSDEELKKPDQTATDAFVFAAIAHQTTILHLIDVEEMLALTAFD